MPGRGSHSIRSAHARIQDPDHRPERPGRRTHSQSARDRQRGLGDRPLHRRCGTGKPREGRGPMRDRQPVHRRLHRDPVRFRLCPQPRGGQERQVGQGPRGQRRVGGPAHGALPRREGIPSLLVGSGVRPARRRTPDRARRPWRQPQAFIPNVFHLQDRGGGRRPDDGARPRRACNHRPPERAVRRQRGMAVLPHGDDAGRHPDPGPARRARAVQPDPRGRHHRDHPEAARRRPRSRRPPSTGAANKPSASRSGAPTSARSSAVEPVFEESAQALRGNPTDATRMRELIGGTTVDWRDGMRRMAAKFHPELVG